MGARATEAQGTIEPGPRGRRFGLIQVPAAPQDTPEPRQRLIVPKPKASYRRRRRPLEDEFLRAAEAFDPVWGIIARLRRSGTPEDELRRQFPAHLAPR